VSWIVAFAIFDNQIEVVFEAGAVCQRLARIKGVGPKTAIVAAVGDGHLKIGLQLRADGEMECTDRTGARQT
jgi:hypothetical protein